MEPGVSVGDGIRAFDYPRLAQHAERLQGKDDPATKRRRSGERRPFLGCGQLEVKTQAELHAARIVRAAQMHEVAARQKRIVDAAIAIATVLSVVEEVERFRAELEPSPLIYGETLKEAEVEVEASGQCESVAADIAETESGGGLEGIGIVKERSTHGWVLVRGEPGPGVACQVGVRASGGNAVAHAGIVAEEAQTVGYGKRLPAFSHGDPGNLPATQDIVGQTGATEERQGVDVAD